MTGLSTTVIVTSYMDRRIERALASLDVQERTPDEVLIADGSVDRDFLAWLRELADAHGARVVHENEATVARARNLALDEAEGDAYVFLDTDQRAPEHWLDAILAPVERGDHDWVGGPTKPLASLYVMELKEERLYAAAREDPTRIPMGNSAWHRRVFDRIGRFDERLAMGGEDWDVALRARAAGFRGTIAEDAWVWHDLRSVDSYAKLARKQYRYNVGGAMAYLKNRQLAQRAGTSYPKVGHHWFDLVESVLKGAAVPVAWWKLRSLRER